MTGDTDMRWLASCPRAVPALLLAELEQFGARDLKELPAGVEFTGTRAVMYRACLWSRLANRVLLPLGSGRAANADELYAVVRAQPWPQLLAPGASFAVEFNGSSAAIRNTRFGAQRAKDAIVDSFRDAGEPAPAVRPAQPDIRVVARLHRDHLEVALDMVGESLHRRGYRRGAGEAPLKENLASALLQRADWPSIAAAGGALIDPMCGSATLLIEGALMALDQAPALGREQFGFSAWRGHDPAQWRAIARDAEGRSERGLERDVPEIRGYDADPRVVRAAQENIAAAGLKRFVRVSVKSLGEVRKPTHRVLDPGLVICNPPYGERIGDRDTLPQLYRHLGETLHREFDGWRAAVLTGDKSLGHALGLRSHRQYSFFNGRLPVSLLLLDLTDNRLVDTGPGSAPATSATSATPAAPALDAGAGMLVNRLRKNQRRLRRWLKREDTDCYRLYDADLPEYAVAVDRYGPWLHVAEYRAPAQIEPEVAQKRLASVRAALPEATGVDASHIVFKTRERQRGSKQYQPQGKSGELLSVHEGRARFLVNLHDYLDTGLFLDHRALRRRIGEEARGKRFLNLFCYTGTATVQAALGGARETVSVDLSNSYLRWLGRNLAHNGLGESRHTMVRADVLEWLAGDRDRFDLILLDPPSFSNSKKMQASFDVQRDHLDLIGRAMARLEDHGVLYFSNNRRRFRLDEDLVNRYDCQEITEETLDPDFPRRPAPHRCWRIRHRADPASPAQ